MNVYEAIASLMIVIGIPWVFLYGVLVIVGELGLVIPRGWLRRSHIACNVGGLIALAGALILFVVYLSSR